MTGPQSYPVPLRHVTMPSQPALMRMVLIRLAAVAVMAALFQVWLRSDEAGQATLGLSQVYYAVVIIVALAWGWRDGRLFGLRTVLGVWVISGMLGGLVAALGIVFGEVAGRDSFDLGVQADLIPFFAGMILLPALIGSLLGHLTKRLPRAAAAQAR